MKGSLQRGDPSPALVFNSVLCSVTGGVCTLGRLCHHQKTTVGVGGRGPREMAPPPDPRQGKQSRFAKSLSREHWPGHSSGGSPKAQGQRSTLATHFGSPRSKIPRPLGLLFPPDTFPSSYANSVDTEASFTRDGLRGPDRCQVMSVRRALQETNSEHLWETD
ncbi:uncharacterized protein WM277_022473 isoform 1-T1 [Molossus nigricans]